MPEPIDINLYGVDTGAGRKFMERVRIDPEIAHLFDQSKVVQYRGMTFVYFKNDEEGMAFKRVGMTWALPIEED